MSELDVALGSSINNDFIGSLNIPVPNFAEATRVGLISDDHDLFEDSVALDVSVVDSGASFYLASVLRDDEGREWIVICRSEDGFSFRRLAFFRPRDFGLMGFSFTTLTKSHDGLWRLYAVGPRGAHHEVMVVEAMDPAIFDPRHGSKVVMLGKYATGGKVVIDSDRGRWHTLAATEFDDMSVVAYGTGYDGRTWNWHGEVLYAMGSDETIRPSALLRTSDVIVAYYDRLVRGKTELVVAAGSSLKDLRILSSVVSDELTAFHFAAPKHVGRRKDLSAKSYYITKDANSASRSVIFAQDIVIPGDLQIDLTHKNTELPA